MSDRYDMPMQPVSTEDALIAKLLQLRAKFRESGFSEVETGRLSDTFLHHWTKSVLEGGGHGSTGA